MIVTSVTNNVKWVEAGKIIIAPKYDFGHDQQRVARIVDGDEADTQRLYYIDTTGKVIREQKAN